MQINEVWADDVANHFGDWRYIDDIYYNFAWAWEIYRWHDERGYCGFRPWAKTAAGKCNN